MNLALKALLFLFGLFFLLEGSANVAYWQNKPTRAIFQTGRLLRATLGLVIVIVSVWGD